MDKWLKNNLYYIILQTILQTILIENRQFILILILILIKILYE